VRILEGSLLSQNAVILADFFFNFDTHGTEARKMPYIVFVDSLFVHVMEDSFAPARVPLINSLICCQSSTASTGSSWLLIQYREGRVLASKQARGRSRLAGSTQKCSELMTHVVPASDAFFLRTSYATCWG
jgi:hypothetical protein